MAIAIDLDGTLAHYDGWKGEDNIGDPVPMMLHFVEGLIANGREVVIFTARADSNCSIGYVKDWLAKHGLPDLEVTNIKRKSFERIYDDRAIQVIKNTGEFII